MDSNIYLQLELSIAKITLICESCGALLIRNLNNKKDTRLKCPKCKIRVDTLLRIDREIANLEKLKLIADTYRWRMGKYHG